MTVKLVVLYPPPADPAAFDSYYTETHLPIVAGLPGLDRIEVARVTGGPGGGEAPWHVITEMYFADVQALSEALRSDAGRATGADLANFAPPGTQMMVAEVTPSGGPI